MMVEVAIKYSNRTTIYTTMSFTVATIKPQIANLYLTSALDDIIKANIIVLFQTYRTCVGEIKGKSVL